MYSRKHALFFFSGNRTDVGLVTATTTTSTAAAAAAAAAAATAGCYSNSARSKYCMTHFRSHALF